MRASGGIRRGSGCLRPGSLTDPLWDGQAFDFAWRARVLDVATFLKSFGFRTKATAARPVGADLWVTTVSL
jgi:hypothetical protein